MPIFEATVASSEKSKQRVDAIADSENWLSSKAKVFNILHFRGWFFYLVPMPMPDPVETQPNKNLITTRVKKIKNKNKVPSKV